MFTWLKVISCLILSHSWLSASWTFGLGVQDSAGSDVQATLCYN